MTESSSRKYWDEKGCEFAKISPPPYSAISWSRLIRSIYAETMKQVLATFKGTDRLLILKTDLWNEGVYTHRGNLCEFLESETKTEAFGIDISAVVCKRAKLQMGERVTVIQADVRCPPFRNSLFNIVFDLSTLDHIPPHQRRATLREYARALKKNGVLLLIFDVKNPFRYLRRTVENLIYGPPQFSWLLNSTEAINLIKGLGFQILREYIAPVSWVAFPSSSREMPEMINNIIGRLNVGCHVERLLRKLSMSKSSKYLMPFAWQYIILAKKMLNA